MIAALAGGGFDEPDGAMTAANLNVGSEPTRWYDPDAAGFDESLVVEFVKREAAPDTMVTTQLQVAPVRYEERRVAVKRP